MSSERRIRASQLNGARSRGPVTPAGRQKSSANSARHHLLSKTILLENERPEAFADLLAGLTGEFNPQTATQRALVETMAVSRWRQMRIWAVERATLQSAMEAHDPNTTDGATRAALAFRSLADDSRTLDVLSRYETRFDRQFARSLNLLIKLDPLRTTGLPAGRSAEGAPLSPQNDFCQTNLIPIPDTSGIGLPACPGAEGASLAPTQPSPETIEPARGQFVTPSTEPVPHVPHPASASLVPPAILSPVSPNLSTEPSTQPSDAPHPPQLAHFPTFIFDVNDVTEAAPAPPPRLPAQRVTSAAAAASILDIR